MLLVPSSPMVMSGMLIVPNQTTKGLNPIEIKNRASLLNAQAIRLRTLRNEMTFAAALKRSREKMQYVQTTKSFDDADSERIRQGPGAIS